MSPKRALGRTGILAGLLLLSGLVVALLRSAKGAGAVPTTLVDRAEFVDYLELPGKVKASRSVTIVAPNQGGDLRILKIVADGTVAKTGDVLVEFDKTGTQQALAQDRSDLDAARAEEEQSRAASWLTEEQDKTDVTKARYDVSVARADARKQEILSRIEGEEGQLTLASAEQKVKEVEAKSEADRARAAAELVGREQKAKLAEHKMHQDKGLLDSLTLRAPGPGLVTLQMNPRRWNAGSAPAWKRGDQTWGGAAIAELPDLTSLEATARLDEADRARVRVGQAVLVRLDAIVGRSFKGKVASISETASPDFEAGWPIQKNFALEVALAEVDPQLTPGMNARLRIVVDLIPNGLVVPSKAVFRKGGRSVVYLLRGSGFRERVVDVSRRSGDQVLLSGGLKGGERVATVDPTAE
jgi:multidrug efflux pump subunit AcrA (membrane-fusion protein)